MDSTRSFRRIAFTLVTAVTGLALCLGPIEPALAQATKEMPIPFGAPSPLAVTISANLPEAANQTYKNIYTELTRAGVIALTNATQLFLGQMAYDAAEYIATGGKGQGKLFFDGKFGEYLTNVGSDAAGEFMASLSDSSFFRGVGFNLCQPRDPTTLLRLQVSLGDLGSQLFPSSSDLNLPSAGGLASSLGFTPNQYNRPRPRCEFQSVLDNYDTLFRTMSDGDVIRNLERSFDPALSQLGTITSVYNRFLTDVQRQVNDAASQREEGNGFRPVEGLISGNIRTPASVVAEATNEQIVRKPGADQTAIVSSMLSNAWEAGPIQLAIYTGSIFVNTLASKFMQRIFEKGLGGSFTPSLSLDLSGPDSVAVYGKTDARNANIDLKNPPPQQVADYDVVSQMQTCLPAQRGTWNCVMDQSLVQAVRSKTQEGGVTVREALERNMLHGDWRLIPTVRTRENQDDQCYTYAYCAGNLQKMRLMRILPVGFELAANSVNNVRRCDTPEGCVTLSEVVKNFAACNDNGQLDDAHPWCHLIDPNWVVTSFPQQCSLTGFSDTLVSSKLPIRKEECQDVKTCLSRNDRGECVGGYGYCMAERSVYRFSADVCPAYAASCRIYTNSAGTKVGYLRNTIDRAACDASNAGCLWYSTRRATSTSETDDWTASTSTGERMYFKAATAGQGVATKGLETCPASEEGCTRLYNFTPGKAALNLMINGSFESEDTTTSTDALAWRTPGLAALSAPYFEEMRNARLTDWTSETAFVGGKSIKLQGTAGIVPQSVWQSVEIVPGRVYSFSTYARSMAGSASLNVGVIPYRNSDGSGSETEIELRTRYHSSLELSTYNMADRTYNAYNKAYTSELTTDWARHEFSFVAPTSSRYAYITLGGVNVLVDGIQLEEGEYATPFVETFSSGLPTVFMKVAPDELQCSRPVTDRSRSALCGNFAQTCSQLEAGCQGYQDQEGGQQIPAILSENDLCPAMCVGYAEYRKAPSSFDLVKDIDPRFSDPEEATSTYFIPGTAGQCTQQDVGCEEFTLLDDNGASDGATAAYSYLRACEKPGTDSETYFTWEGADTVGYQLRTWSLKRDTGPFDLGPRILTKIQADQISFKEPDTCNEGSWRTAADPDCRQFYDARGRIFYRYFSQTILSANECTNVRLTRSSRNDCERTGGRYNERGECTYGAYLPESRSCNARATSCRMYMGASAGNTQATFRQSFREDFAPFGRRGLTTSTEALLVGDVSVKVGDPGVSGEPERPLGYAQTRALFDSSETALYRATFWAKAPATSTSITVRTTREDGGGEAVIGTVRLTPEWQRYTVGLFEGAPNASSTYIVFTAPLLRSAGFGFYFDEVSVTRVQDVVYVRNNTWTTPAQCDQGLDGADEPQAMLNCKAYTNRVGQTVNARRFTRLCRETAIGCSAFVDTRNTDETYARRFVQRNPIDPTRHVPSVVVRPADRYIYLIDDPAKRCNSQNMSCRAFGKPKLAPDRQRLDVERPYETVYYKDDITRYDSALCKPSEAFCAEFKFGTVKEYFRDPATSVCEYRQPVTTEASAGVPSETLLGGWYVKGSDATPCYPSILENGRTYGIARSGDQTYKGYVGACEEAAGECIELRDINDTSDPAQRAGKSYFYIKNDRLDVSTCNGQVDLGRGCVLFRDMSSGALTYNARASYEQYKTQGYKPVTPVDCRNNPENPACVQGGRCRGTRATVTRRISGDPGTAYNNDQDAILQVRGTAVPWTGDGICRTDDDCRVVPNVTNPTVITYNVNNGGALERRTTSTAVVVTEANCQAPPPDQANDANLLLKVSVDRECSQWLGCRSSETVLDPSTNKYKEICSVPALCDKGSGVANDQFCASYVDRRSTSTEPILAQGQVLTASLYAGRGLGLGQRDYSGYAIPDSFQVMDLQNVRVAVEGAKNIPDAAFRLSQEYRLTAAIPMPPLRRITVGGVTRYQHTLRPGLNQAKILNEYQWSDASSDGLAISNPTLALCKHVSSGRIGYYIPSQAADDRRSANCYLPVNTSSELFNFDKVSQTFSASVDAANAALLTRAYPPAECRAQPEQDAPYPASFTTDWDMTKNPPKPLRRLAGFASANTCEFGEDCSCTYKRVEYESSPAVKFYNQYSQSSPPGVCVGGPRDGQSCVPSKIFNAGTNVTTAPADPDGGQTDEATSNSGARANAVNDASSEQLCGPPELGGRCMPFKAVTIIRGTFGSCLERDLSRTIGQNKDLTPCLTWNPTLLLNGDKDPYHYEQSAGYMPPQNSGQYYCLSNARKPKTVPLNSNFFFKTPGEGGTYSGRITKLGYFDGLTSDGDLAEGNDLGARIDGGEPAGSNVSYECELTDDDQDVGGFSADFSALRLINTGRGARQYWETFFRISPAAFAKAYHGRDATTENDIMLSISDRSIGYIGLSPISSPNSTARLACAYNQDWVDGISTPDYTDINAVHGQDSQWQQKFNADFKGVLTRSSEDLIIDPASASGASNVLRDPCIETTAAYRGQTCYFKTWETGYRTVEGDDKTKFVGLSAGNREDGSISLTGSRRTFETLRISTYNAKCDQTKPYFSVRAVFQSKINTGDRAPLPRSEFGTIATQWTMAGFWVTACGGASTDEHYIYMRPRVEYSDVCRELAEVVSRDSKQDAAFTDRVWKDGNFTIPVLGISYNARYSPFSSALNTRNPGVDPLFQTGQEVVGYSRLNPPTFLASGYRTYYSNDPAPKDKWAHLTNIFARVYNIYKYHESQVANGQTACLAGPNKGQKCTPSGDGTSPDCSSNGRCDASRLAASGVTEFTAERCNALSGINAGLTCLPGERREDCHIAPMQLTGGGVDLRTLPCLTQPGWRREGDLWINGSAPGVAQSAAATAGAFRCPNTPASLRRDVIGNAWGGLAWTAGVRGHLCSAPTDQGEIVEGSEECPERIVNGLEIAPASGAPITAQGDRRMQVQCVPRTAGVAITRTAPGRCRVVVPPYSINVPGKPAFEMPSFSTNPDSEGYAYGECTTAEDCSFTMDNYYLSNAPTMFDTRMFASSRSLQMSSTADTRRGGFTAGGCGTWPQSICRGLASGGMWIVNTGNPRLENASAVYEAPSYTTAGRGVNLGRDFRQIEYTFRYPGAVQATGYQGMILVGACIQADNPRSGASTSRGLCTGGTRDGRVCGTDSDCVAVDSVADRPLSRCGPVSTRASDNAPWEPVSECRINDTSLQPAGSPGVNLNNDNNICTHKQGYVPRIDLCPNPNDQYCGLIAYNVRRPLDSVATAAPARLPTDVTLGLHKLPYLLGEGDVDAPDTYSATYLPRPPMVAAPDIRNCPSPGKCQVQGLNKMSLDGSSEGIVSVPSSQAKSVLRFYAWAAHNQMPLRSINLDWGDGQVQAINDGKLKNHKPYCAVRKECVTISRSAGVSRDKVDSNGLTCNTDNDCPTGGGSCQAIGTCRDNTGILCTNDSQCRSSSSSKDVCQIRNFFGNSAEACEENYFEFTHLYTCNGPGSLPLCRRPALTGRTTGGQEVVPASVELTGGCHYGRYEADMMNGRPTTDRAICDASTGVSPLVACIRSVNQRLSLTGAAALPETTDAATANGISCVTRIPETGTNANHCERDPNRICNLADVNSCAPGDRCLPNLAPTGGCWDDQVQVCRFTPRVMVQDNWGWCTGECRTTRDSGGAAADDRNPSAGGPIALHPYGGCYAATPVGSDRPILDNNERLPFRNECRAILPTSGTGNQELRPWIVYPGSINLRSNR